MSSNERIDEAVDLLQQLGLKEYEARCFVGLTRLSTGTAKDLSEVTDVPRTRVYDAIRVLEATGLVEVQHSNPKQFRAVALDEATETLKTRHQERITKLHRTLESLERVDAAEQSPVQEVWSLIGSDAIENRTDSLLSGAENEVVLVLGAESLLTPKLVEKLTDLPPNVSLIVGALTPSLEQSIKGRIPNATTFVSGLEWLHGQDDNPDGVSVGRLLLVDRETLLVSSIVPRSGTEQAVYGRGLGNGLVVIARRIMSEGLLSERDPGQAS